MDKELKDLQKRVIGLLIEYEDQLAAVKDANQLKKTRRVSSSVAYNIAAFPDIIDNMLSAGVPVEEMTKKLRNFQEGLLRDIVRIKGTETGHHINQLRTGGNFYRGPIEVWQPTVERLSDFFETKFGDHAENIRSYINLAHKSDTNTKGLEKLAIGETANPFKALTAHVLNTNSKEIVGNLTPEQLNDPDLLFNELAKRIDFQQRALKGADLVQQRVVETVQSFAPNAYTGGIEEAKETQKLTALPENQKLIQEAISSTYDDLLQHGAGVVRLLDKIPLAAKLGIGATGFGALLDVGDVKAGLTNKPDETASPRIQRMEQAANALRVQSGVVGLGSLFAGGPGAALSAITGTALGIYQDRVNRAKEKERQLRKVESRDYDLGPTTITKPKPRNTTRELNLR